MVNQSFKIYLMMVNLNLHMKVMIVYLQIDFLDHKKGEAFQISFYYQEIIHQLCLHRDRLFYYS